EGDGDFGVGGRGSRLAGAVAGVAAQTGEAPVVGRVLADPPGLLAGRGGAAVERFGGGPAGSRGEAEVTTLLVGDVAAEVERFRRGLVADRALADHDRAARRR